MRISDATSHTLTASVTLAMLAGCSGGSSQVTPYPRGQVEIGSQGGLHQALQNGRVNSFLYGARISGGAVTTHSFMNARAAQKPLIFVSTYYDSSGLISIYLQRNGKMVGQISGLLPAGLRTDADRNLYAANFNSTNVLVYAPPYTGAPKLTLDDGGYYPWDVAVSPRGVVAVANECKAPSCPVSSATVRFYAKNSTTPCATIGVPAAIHDEFGIYAAFDHKGNLYIAGSYSPSAGHNVAQIGEVKGGCKAAKAVQLRTANSIHAAQGLQIDKAGRLAFLGESAAFTNVIYTYNLPKTRSLGKPVSTADLKNSYGLTELAFTSSGRDLYTVESGSTPEVLKYDYPAGGVPDFEFSAGGKGIYGGGIAVTPALVP